mgnify:CR=1 FL=1
MAKLSRRATKRLVYERANGCCEYCQTCEHNTGQSMHIEHIDPNGGDDLSNLCLSCSNCNYSKSDFTSALDPETNTQQALFNPRMQLWDDHFLWVDGGLRIQGKTDVGRATIVRLKMNQSRVVRARNNWIIAGSHPPTP